MKKAEKRIVTIIVAIYNGEKYLPECVRSILNQSYGALEIILVDDGSTDSSLSICKEYASKDKRIKIIHQQNAGVSVARNNALKIATGEYVCFMDQDDFIADDYIEFLLQLIEKTKSQISVVPNVVYYSEGKYEYHERRDQRRKDVWSGMYAAREMLYGKMEIGPWSKMISRDLIEKNNLRFREGIFGGDGYIFSVEAFANAERVAVGYKGVYNYRVDNYESEMSKYRPRTFRSSLKAVKIMMNEFEHGPRGLRRASRYAYWRVFVAFLNMLIASGSKEDFADDYKTLVRNSRKYAYRSFMADVSLRRKIKDLLYFVSPSFVARLNVMRDKKRKFNRRGA